MLDAIVTAGGIPKEGEPLFPLTQGRCKALLDIAGKPMIQWVVDALEQATTIRNIIIVGLPESFDFDSKKIVAFLPNGEDMLANIRSGVSKVLEIDPMSHHVVLASSDIPAITAPMVDWLVNTAMQTDEDVYYTILKQEVMEEQYPHSRRSFIHLKDMDVCGGDMNLIRTTMVTTKDELWKKIIASRKNVFSQAALIGYDTLILLLLRMLSMEQAIKTVIKRMEITGRALVCPYPQLGMDIDKPHQFEMVEKELKKRIEKTH